MQQKWKDGRRYNCPTRKQQGKKGGNTIDPETISPAPLNASFFAFILPSFLPIQHLSYPFNLSLSFNISLLFLPPTNIFLPNAPPPPQGRACFQTYSSTTFEETAACC